MIYSSWDIEQNILKLAILGHFLSFYPPKNPKNQNFEKWKKLLKISLFYPCVPPPPPSPPLMIPNIKILKKMKKMSGDIILWYIMCTINEDHMIYSSWNIRCDRQKFSTFLAIFCHFSPLTTWKIKILILKKTPGDIIILQICTIYDNHMIYGS